MKARRALGVLTLSSTLLLACGGKTSSTAEAGIALDGAETRDGGGKDKLPDGACLTNDDCSPDDAAQCLFAIQGGCDVVGHCYRPVDSGYSCGSGVLYCGCDGGAPVAVSGCPDIPGVAPQRTPSGECFPDGG